MQLKVNLEKVESVQKISKHISYKEGTYSNTATRLGLENKPTEKHLANMELLAEKIFEPLRKHVNGPIKINSFYRGPELNKAIDIDDTYGYMSNADMYKYVKANLNFDQMIWEFGTDENPDWVHISYVNEEANRNRCLKAYREDGKTKYMVI